MRRAESKISTLLPHTSLVLSPLDALQSYRRTTERLMLVLYTFAVPSLSLAIYFVSMISGLMVQRQMGEIAMLKSRGAGSNQVLLVYVAEGLVIIPIGVGLGLLLGRQAAVLIGETVSFLTIGAVRHLEVGMTPMAIRTALVGACVALIASLVPAWRACRLTIVSYSRQSARDLDRPFWQRHGLDFVLLVPAWYGFYLMQGRRAVGFLTDGGTADPLSDPFMFLVPSLMIWAFAMIFIRVFPFVIRGLAPLVSRMVRSASVTVALNQLARAPMHYRSSLLLVVLTLSLSVFYASMAQTMERSLTDQARYRNGATFRFTETGIQMSGGAEADVGQAGVAGVMDGEMAGDWRFVALERYLDVPGVTGATRVGTYPVETITGGEGAAGMLYGVDRTSLPQVAFFRRDFAPRSLGALMNSLAERPSNLLVDPAFLARYQLGIGDPVILSFGAFGERARIEFIIADVIAYFPTHDPTDGRHLFVTNLEYLFEQMGTMFPYDVWLSAAPEVQTEALREALFRGERPMRLACSSGATRLIVSAHAPEYSGFVGLLTVGYVAAALLTIIGFSIHAAVSLRRRFVQLGILRALGLSLGQMVGAIATETVTLVASGVTGGTLLGIWMSHLFVPLLYIEPQAQVPPFIVSIAWHDILRLYLFFGVMLLLVILSVVALLMRMKSFEAVKLGQTI